MPVAAFTNGGPVPPTSNLRIPPGAQIPSPLLKVPSVVGACRGNRLLGARPVLKGCLHGCGPCPPMLSLSISLMAGMPWTPSGGHIRLALERGSIPFCRGENQSHRGSKWGPTYEPSLSGPQPPGKAFESDDCTTEDNDLTRRGQVFVRIF